MEALREEIYDHTSDPAQESFRNQQYQRSSMQRSAIVDRLRREGCRITKQRKIILDIILQEECTCCKEIYFLASKKDPNIGMATLFFHQAITYLVMQQRTRENGTNRGISK